jgi:hypothetical protein
MSLENQAGRFRYILTRPCLDSGSIAVLKYLENIMPLTGSVVFVGDGGEEIKLTADPKTRRLYGLGDYYAKHRLQINDTLFITALAERRFALERVIRVRDTKSEAKPRPAPPPKPERIILEESPYIREVRTRDRTVLPYSKGLLYPQERTDGATPDETKRAEPREQTPAKPKPADEARSTLKNLIARDRDQRSSDSTRAEPVAAPVEVAPQPMPFVADRSSTTLEHTRAAFIALGYGVDVIGEGLMLEAKLGRRAHRIALAVTDDIDEARTVLDVGRGQAAKYLAIAAKPAALQAFAQHPDFEGIAQADPGVIEALGALTRLSPVGPLELEGYWNAGRLDANALESLEASVNTSVGARGAFSFVTLTLARFQAPGVVSAQDVMAGIESTGIGSGVVLETLESLSRAPFMLLSPLGGGEYYMRRPVSVALEGLSEYAGGLRSRLHVTAKVAARADSALTEVK